METVNDKKKDPLGSFDDLNFDSIECSGEVFKRFAWKNYRRWSIAVIIGSIILLMISILVGPVTIIIAISVLFLYFNRLSMMAKTLFMKEFAERNRLSYEFSPRISDVTGNLFKLGRMREISHVLTGNYRGQKAKFFYYTYSIGQGRNTRTYVFTIMEIFFEKTEFPYILLRAKGRGLRMIMKRYGKLDETERKIRLEEEFEKDFDLFAKDGYGVEVMQIFSKDFLRFLKEKGSNFSIELQGNRIYIYDDILVKEKKQLQEFFEVTGNLVGRIAPLLNRLDNDFAVLHRHYKK